MKKLLLKLLHALLKVLLLPVKLLVKLVAVSSAKLLDLVLKLDSKVDLLKD